MTTKDENGSKKKWSYDEVRTEVIAILTKHSGDNAVQEITDEQDIMIDLKIDSLDFVEIIMAVEEKFRTNFPDNEITDSNIKVVKELVTYVYEKVNKSDN